MGARIIAAIAWQTFTEARRNKVFYSVFFFGLVVVLNSVLFTEVTIVALDRILKDTGIAVINLTALLLTIFAGVGIINREIDRRTIYSIIAKPIPRYYFVVGKYLGLLGVTLATSSLMFMGLLAVMVAFKTPVTGAVFAGYYGIILEMSVLAAFALLCSSFTSSFVSAFCTIAVFVSGHVSGELLFYANKSQSLLFKSVGRVLYYAVPNLERFNLKLAVTYDLAVPAVDLAWMAMYGSFYVAAFLLGSVVVFSNRDFR